MRANRGAPTLIEAPWQSDRIYYNASARARALYVANLSMHAQLALPAAATAAAAAEAAAICRRRRRARRRAPPRRAAHRANPIRSDLICSLGDKEARKHSPGALLPLEALMLCAAQPLHSDARLAARTPICVRDKRARERVGRPRCAPSAR